VSEQFEVERQRLGRLLARAHRSACCHVFLSISGCLESIGKP
jgi:hypothetical protein